MNVILVVYIRSQFILRGAWLLVIERPSNLLLIYNEVVVWQTLIDLLRRLILLFSKGQRCVLSAQGILPLVISVIWVTKVNGRGEFFMRKLLFLVFFRPNRIHQIWLRARPLDIGLQSKVKLNFLFLWNNFMLLLLFLVWFITKSSFEVQVVVLMRIGQLLFVTLRSWYLFKVV